MNFNRFAQSTFFKTVSFSGGRANNSSVPSLKDNSRLGRLGNKTAIGALTVITAVAAAPKEAGAQWTHNSSVHNTSTPVNTQTFAPALEGISGWGTLTTTSGAAKTFGLTIYDQWTAYTAAHILGLNFPGATINQVGTSLNSNNPGSGQVVGIAGYDFDPQYDGLYGNDTVRIRFSSPIDLSKFPNRPNGPLPIATSLANGDTFYLSGRDKWGSPDIGVQTSDGQLRVSTAVGSDNPSSLFTSHWAGKYSLSIGDVLNSIGVPGMSGSTSGVFRYNILTARDDFYFLGPISGGTFPTPAHEGYTYVAKADPSFIIVPEPAGLAGLSLAGIVLARRTRK